MSISSDLQSILHGEIETDDVALTHASRDASIFSVRPKAVVHPMNIDDVKALVKYASSHPDASLTVRSGGTDMGGGTLTESIVVDMASHINRIGTVRNDTINIEPGAYYKDMEKTTLLHGLIMPSYPASKHICTVGGMVNNNAGGEKTLLYGKTEQYIETLKVVLADGNEYELRPLSLGELKSAMQEKTFLGEVYTNMYELLEKNYEKIQAARPHVSKNSAGYALWNIWDKKTFDLTKLFCGSQGTLGITTSITFRLISLPKKKRMLVLFLPRLDQLADITQRILAYHPESFESYDDHTLSLALRFFPSFSKQLKTSSLSLALKFIPELLMMLRSGFPKMVLIAEFTGNDEKEVMSRTHAAQRGITQYEVTSKILSKQGQQDLLWAIRRESFSLLRNHVKEKQAAPFIDDFIIDVKHLASFLPRIAIILEHYNIDYSIAGHIGNGNFHIIPLINMKYPAERNAIPTIMKQVYSLVFAYNGSSTAEHNDGLIRSHLLPQMFGQKIYSLFEQTKQIFDPKNIFNPGKKVNADWAWAQQHIIT